MTQHFGMSPAAHAEKCITEKWCSGCKAWHLRDAFHKDGSRRDGLASYCRASLSKPRPSPLARFMSHVMKAPSGCWFWTGCINASGYGTFQSEGKSWLAHRWAYRFIRGLNPGPELHHAICRTRCCVNPDHVKPVDPNKHPDKISVLNLAKQECPQGHQYEGKNLYIDRQGHRHCRACRREVSKADWWKHRAARLKKQDEWYQRNKETINARRRKKG